jgi:hypothetical protein
VPDPRAPRGLDARLAEVAGLLNEARQQLRAPAGVPGLHLTPLQVAVLETALGVSVPLTPATLVARVEAVTAVSIGDVRIPFTPGQLQELSHRAQKRGRTLDQEIRAVVARISDELFHQGG